MKKQIKKYGNSLVVTFTAEDQRIYGMNEGSVVDLTDMIVLDDTISERHETAEDQLSAISSRRNLK